MLDHDANAERLARIETLAADYVKLDPSARRDTAIAYLFEVAELLSMKVGGEAVIAPLLEIIPFVADPVRSPLFCDRRLQRSVPSDAVLARCAAAIDVLISMGRTTDIAAQTVARQMVHAHTSLPDYGGDVRGWKRLILWRERLISLKKPAEAWDVYQEMLHDIACMDRREVVRRALDGTLWDERARRAEQAAAEGDRSAAAGHARG